MRKAGAFLKPFPFFIISSCLYFPQVGIILLIDYDTAHEIGKPLKWNVSLKGCYGSANCGVPQDFYPGLQSVSQSVSSVAPVVSDSLRPHELQHARPPCPSPTQSLLKLMSIESLMPSNHLILCHPLLLPPIPLSIRVFSSLQFTRKCFVSLLLTFSCFNSLLTKYQEPQQKNSSNCTYTAVRQKGVMPLKVNHYLRVGSNVHGSCH